MGRSKDTEEKVKCGLVKLLKDSGATRITVEASGHKSSEGNHYTANFMIAEEERKLRYSSLGSAEIYNGQPDKEFKRFVRTLSELLPYSQGARTGNINSWSPLPERHLVNYGVYGHTGTPLSKEYIASLSVPEKEVLSEFADITARIEHLLMEEKGRSYFGRDSWQDERLVCDSLLGPDDANHRKIEQDLRNLRLKKLYEKRKEIVEQAISMTRLRHLDIIMYVAQECGLEGALKERLETPN